jgi:hypothetical protein
MSRGGSATNAAQVTRPSGGVVTLVDPYGRVIMSDSYSSTLVWLKPVVLAVPGKHQVVVDFAAAPGSAAAQIWTVGADIVSPVPTTGDPTSSAMTAPGQELVFRFPGTAGQRVLISEEHSPPNPILSLNYPGSNQGNDGWYSTSDPSPIFVGPFTLPVTREYRAEVSRSGDTVTSGSVRVWTVGPDVVQAVPPTLPVLSANPTAGEVQAHVRAKYGYPIFWQSLLTKTNSALAGQLSAWKPATPKTTNPAAGEIATPEATITILRSKTTGIPSYTAPGHFPTVFRAACDTTAC